MYPLQQPSPASHLRPCTGAYVQRGRYSTESQERSRGGDISSRQSRCGIFSVAPPGQKEFEPMGATLLNQAVLGRWPTGDGHTGPLPTTRVYLRLAALADEEHGNIAYPSQRKLAEEMNMSRRDVLNVYRSLEYQSFIELVQRHKVGRHGNVYLVRVFENCRRSKSANLPDGVKSSCRCSYCAALDGKVDGEVAGTTDGASPVQELEKPSNKYSITDDADVGLQYLPAMSDPVRIARNAVSEVARSHATGVNGQSTFAEVRSILDDALFAQAVAHARKLLEDGNRPADAAVLLEKFVEKLATSVGIV